jgi:hypothetical protein
MAKGLGDSRIGNAQVEIAGNAEIVERQKFIRLCAAVKDIPEDQKVIEACKD